MELDPRDSLSSTLPSRTHSLCYMFASNWVSFRPNHQLCMYTNSRLWFSKRIVHRASSYPHAAAQVQADEAFLPRAAGLWWSAASVWPGIAECPEDLAEGPGVGCGVRVDSGKYRPGPGNDYQLLLRKERGPQKDSSCLSLLEKDIRTENFKRNFKKKNLYAVLSC